MCIWIQTLASAPLKTLFPQSITFDCYCTKRRVMNLGACVHVFVCACVCVGVWQRGDSVGKDYITRRETRKKTVMWNIKVTPQCLCDIGFHIINLQPLLLSLRLVTHSTGHWLTGWCQYFNVRMHNLTVKWGEHFILNEIEAVWKCEHRKWKRRRDSPAHSSYPLMEHKWINWEMGEGKIGSCKKCLSFFLFHPLSSS